MQVSMYMEDVPVVVINCGIMTNLEILDICNGQLCKLQSIECPFAALQLTLSLQLLTFGRS